MTAVRLLVCGGRTYNDLTSAHAALNLFASTNKVELVIQGGAKGADKLGKIWAHMQGLPCIEIDAAWGYYGKRAGHIRNAWMLDIATPNYCIAFPGGFGTADMVKACKAADVTVWQPYG